ncbi:hypothetical protein PRJ39_08825 [Lysobacter enzymogenes]|uniref:hypothetical protein n=1 Tax=Lysobacter enzymogenes TaxID=69 RepID=UPI00374A8C37
MADRHGRVPVTGACSLAFDEMEEDEFAEFFRGITNHIDKTYLAGLTDEMRTEYLLMERGA